MTSEIERDYIRGKKAASGCLQAALPILAMIVVVVLGGAAGLWLFGVVLMAWPVVLVAVIVGVFWWVASHRKRVTKLQKIHIVSEARTRLPTDQPATDVWLIRTEAGEYGAASVAELQQYARERRFSSSDYIFNPDVRAWSVAFDLEPLREMFP